MKIWRVEFCQATFSTVLTLIVFTFIAIVPVIMKIWLRKIINVKSSNLLNSIRFIFFYFRSGCTQYHFGSSGTNYVQTFNFQSSGSGKHLADQTQVICVRYVQ